MPPYLIFLRILLWSFLLEVANILPPNSAVPFFQLVINPPEFFIIGSGKKYSVLDFVKKSFNYVGLNYKKHLKIDKKLFRPSKTASLVGDTKKAKRTIRFKPKTTLDQLISIMMENDLKIEKNNF